MMPTELLSPGIFQMLAAVLVPLIAAGHWRNILFVGNSNCFVLVDNRAHPGRYPDC